MKYKKIVSAVNKLLSEQTPPLNTRQIYYHLLSARDVLPNTEYSYKTLYSILEKAKRQKDIDGERIVDL